ncbi:MAG: cytochrome c [Pseudomonadota bacterium]|nr:cytochrome c [Pseudomonadota bacterium]
MTKRFTFMVTAWVSTIVASSIISGNLSAHSGVLNNDGAARMKVMSEIAKNMSVLGKMLKKKDPFDKDKAVSAVEAIESLAVETPKVFKKREMDPKSEAKLTIWEDFEAFTKIANKLSVDAKQITENLQSFDDIRPALINLSQSCKSCHSRFRK